MLKNRVGSSSVYRASVFVGFVGPNENAGDPTKTLGPNENAGDPTKTLSVSVDPTKTLARLVELR